MEIDLLTYGVDAPPEQPRLTALYLKGDESHCLAFTTYAERHPTHDCWEGDMRGTFLCKGPTCLLCKVGKKQESRILLPVYDLLSECVRVLAMSEARTPYALLPQIQQALAKVKEHGPQLLSLKKEGTSKFLLQMRDLPPGIDDGALKIQQFKSAVEDGTVRLADVLRSLSDEELRDIPSVSRALKVKGLE